MTEERVEQTAQQAPPEQTRPEPTAEQELEQRLLRALADLDNLRKRTAREMERELARERSRLAAAWLPVIDGLDRAVQHGSGPDDGQGCAGLVEGVRALRDQAVTIMERLGYPRFEDIGRRFDPMRHEAVGVVADPDAEPMTVVGVVRPGYGTDEQVLRPASVLVAGGPEQAG